MTSIPFAHVALADPFWTPRQEINRTVTLREEYRHLVATHRIDALRMNWHPGLDWTPHEFWDSDTAKWVEAAAYCLAAKDDAELRGWMEGVVDLIVAAQQPDGYINSYITQVCPDERWKNLRDKHELYGIGHLIEAAVAHFQCTGDRRFLAAMIRCADHLAATFGTGPGQIPGYCGHQEIELALFRLADVTGEERFARLAEYFLNQRGQQPHYFALEAEARGDSRASWLKMHVEEGYSQAHVPIREQHRVVGHAVRAIYMYTAMADLAARQPGDTALSAALDELWAHLMERNAYLTGGVGSSRHNEGFTRDYDLPNDTAYCETCASAALIFWASRMLHRRLDSRYADTIETLLYNALLHGVSQDGRTFYYDNRLAEFGDHPRAGWFGCACCPPNLARVVASVGSFLASATEKAFVLHQFLTARVEDPQRRTFQIVSDYLESGKVSVTVTTAGALEEIRFRVPGWAPSFSVTINNQPVTCPVEKGYAIVRRPWQDGDRLALHFPVAPRIMHAHPLVEADANRGAVCRGPLVYAFEQADHPESLGRLRLPWNPTWTEEISADIGLTPFLRLSTAGRAAVVTPLPPLYDTRPPAEQDAALVAVPYYLTGNRTPDAMRVWLPFTRTP